MKIAILTMGTRGDVQPYAVLGQALQRRGHEVSVATAKNFEKLVLSYGLRFVPVEADFQAVLDSDEGKKMLKGNPLAIRRNLEKWVYPLITSSLSVFYELASQSDLTLYHVKTLADTFADQFPDKMLRASVLPIVEPTAAFANPALSGLPIPSFLNKLTYKFANASIKMLKKPIREFRKNAGLPADYQPVKVKNIYGLSPVFLPKPSDLAPDSRFSGFWMEAPTGQLNAALEQFLNAGPPPLLITFGSMPFEASFDLQRAVISLQKQTGIRILLVKGWGFENTELIDNQKDIHVIESAPYALLFSRVAGIIHHGGIGTTAECLRAGRPSWVCPVMYPLGDQLFWGNAIYQHGLGPKPVPVKKLTENLFLQKASELLNTPAFSQNARRMGGAISQENGAERTAEYLEQLMHWQH